MEDSATADRSALKPQPWAAIPLWSRIALLALTLLVLAWAAFSLVEWPSRQPQRVDVSSPPPVKLPQSDEDRAKEVVLGWLDDLKAGRAGEYYWRDFSVDDPYAVVYGKRIRPNAVRSGRILSTRTREADLEADKHHQLKVVVMVTVQVDCSDAAGNHITRNWKLTVAGDHISMKIVGAI
jgi:hypothetical protein